MPERSRATVIAHAPGHDFKASGTGVSGTIELLELRVQSLDATFPLAALDAGDPLGNRELKRFLDLGAGPVARAILSEEDGKLTFSIGSRSMTTAAVFHAPKASDAQGIAKFALTFSGLGYTAPKMLFLKVKDTLEIEVSTELQPVDG